MSATVDLTKFREAVEARRKEQAAQLKASQPAASADADLIPDLPYEKSEQDQELDRVIDSIGIIDAYTRWCGKSTPKKHPGQTESIKVSCPIPGHADKNPSAWLNTEKGAWYCGTCEQGGDAYDIAAYHFGMPVPGYKSGSNFHELRRKMAESMGYTFIQPPGVPKPIPVAPADPSDFVAPDTTPAEATPPAEVVGISPEFDEDDSDDLINFPTLDWSSLIQPQTFLDSYMRATHIDDVPEEYHLWNGLVALGLAIGRDVTLYDRVPVYGNLFLCLLGATGDGKSRSFSHLRLLLRTALPHKWSDPGSKGAHYIMAPGSAEVLISNFSKPVTDPVDPKRIAYYAPVRALVEFNELSALAARTNRQGNAMKPALMEFYDMAPTVGTSSITTGKKEAEQPFASVFTTTQPSSLQDLMTKGDADSGFLNRWIFASGKPKQRIAIGGVKIDIADAVKPLQEVQGWAGFGKEIVWTTEAAERFTEFFHATLRPAQLRDKTGFLTRLDLTMKKLILLLTVNIKQDKVPLEIVEQVLSMFEYMVAAYGIPAEKVGNTAALDATERVLSAVKRFKERKGHPPTQREIYLSIKSRKINPELIHKTLKILTDMGMLEAVTVNTGKVGRPSVRYNHVG